MLIDSVMFFNELDLLEDRLNYLDPYVDYFVINESNYSFGGKEKQLVFDANKDRYSKFAHKIIHNPFIESNYNYTDPFRYEFAQRNHIVNALNEFSDNDYVIVSCLDEIPNRSKLKEATDLIKDHSIVVRLFQNMYVYNLNTKQENVWNRSFVCTKKTLVEQTPTWLSINDNNVVLHITDNVRDDREYSKVFFDHLHDGGWHLCNFMSVDDIIIKMEQYSHVEYNTEYYKNRSRIEDCIKHGKDLYDRGGGCNCVFINPDEEFPEDFLMQFNRWRNHETT